MMKPKLQSLIAWLAAFLPSWLTKILAGVIIAVAVIKPDVVGIHVVKMQVAVFVVVAIWLVVTAISQPPGAAILRSP